jgi:hypothetical protein
MLYISSFFTFKAKCQKAETPITSFFFKDFYDYAFIFVLVDFIVFLVKSFLIFAF